MENIDFLGKNITVMSTNPDDSDVVKNTVIDAGDSGSVVTFANGEGPEAVLCGFTITGGYGTVNSMISEEIYWGAGIYCDGASPTIIQNIIEGNYGPIDGQDIAGYGGGIACFQSNAIISRNRIIQNEAYAGAGVMVYVGQAIIANNVIRDNSAVIGGGVVLLLGGELVHNTIRNNSGQAAGNIYAASDEGYPIKIINNIIINAVGGGGIYGEGFKQYTAILYNDVWSNTDGNYLEFSNQTGINGNISADPGFADGYHISSSSPCYEAGDPAFIPYSWQRDIDGQAAVMHYRPDMGADEVTGNARPVADAGENQFFNTIPEIIVLDGTHSYDFDIDDVLTYTWTQTNGPSVTLLNEDTAQPSFIPSVEDVYQFELTVSDGVLTSFPDEVLIVVGNQAPVANAGSDKTVQIGDVISLDGADSYDPDFDSELSYTWTQIEGPAVVLQDSDTAIPYFDCIENGLYVFELVVSDGHKQSMPDTVELVSVELIVTQQDLNLSGLGTYAHYGDISGDKVVYGVGSACDYTWDPKYKNLTTGSVSSFSGKLMQPKIDGDLVVWMKYGNGFGNPWSHEPCNSSVFVRNLVNNTQKTLRNWTWSDSYGHPVISGTKVIWMEHHDLDPKPTGSSEANNWWNTPFSIYGADVSDWNNPVFFTVDENVGRHDPYPCLSYGEDFDDVVDICDDIVVWEADGNIYGADISNLQNIRVFPICLDPERQYDPAISGNQVVWTDERNDGGDIYGADISDRDNIKVFEIIKQNGTQQQAAIDGILMVYVDGSFYGGQIKVSCLSKRHGAIDISLGKDYFGTGPAIDGNVIIWQSAPYGEALGISLDFTYSIADGSVKNITQTKQYDYIQYAINEAVSGDEIIVDSGVYEENINFNGKNLILRSSDPTSTTVVTTTIIQGLGNDSVVTFAGTEDETCVLSGFTITGGLTSERGGGILGNGTQAGIFNCVIENNAAAFGGGIDQCHGRIEKCTIAYNTASANGGGLAVCHGEITNCLVYGNSAAAYGGGLNYCNGAVSNCTIADNTASSNGGAMKSCSGIITNNIIWANSVSEISICSEPTYCCYQGATGEGNIDTDPLFVDPNAEDYYLSPDSPCIDAGDINTIPQEGESDIDGWTRMVGLAVDIGAYEYDGQHARISLPSKTIHLYVSEDISLTANDIFLINNAGGIPLTWEINHDCPWLMVDPSIGQTTNGTGELVVSVDASELHEGVYKYTVNISSDNAVNSNQPFEVILHVNRTILYVPSQYKTIQHAIEMSQDSEMIVVSPGVYHENIDLGGKNVILTSIDPTDTDIVKNTIIQELDNKSVVTFDGSENQTCVLNGFTITGGSTSGRGGGICGNGTQAGISNCIIRNNTAAYGGGVDQCHGKIEKCIIANNSASVNGGGLAVCGGIIANCLVYGNSAGNYGGGLHYCNGTINNCTIADNTASLGGGLNNCSGTISNCIVWNNTPVDALSISSPTYCCSPGLVGEGNIDIDPLFINPASGDYHLRPDSPCVDVGADVGVYDDIEGNLRPFNILGVDNNGRLGEFDMGAYEQTVPIIEVPLKFSPNTVNCYSNGKFVKAHIALPEEFQLENVDINTPAFLEPFSIDSEYINAFVNQEGIVEIEIAFARADLCNVIINAGTVEVSVTGAFATGQYFYGTDTINLTIDNLRQIAIFVSQWLQTGVGLDADLDKDGCVDLKDFSILAKGQQ
ncbi:MAG: right-handed parallel beta-helix repeat-containing protein [Phycisphaerae bacterium]|nr:right-handed parallel beta-helix repeat-containing protein [Phycisphaerae bacterium]